MALINKLNALGDLVREKTGKHTRIEVIRTETFVPGMIVSKTANATGFDTHEGAVPTKSFYDVVKLEGAAQIKVKVGWQIYLVYHRLTIGEGDYTLGGLKNQKEYNGDFYSSIFYQEDVYNGDTITFYYSTNGDSTAYDNLGYYAECIALDENGNEIGDKVIVTEEEVEVKNTMTLDEMATELSNIETGGGSVEELPAAEGSEF